MITNFTQRWNTERKSVYIPVREYFNPRDFEISDVPEAAAKGFVEKFHYSGSFPACRRRFGLFQKGRLVGAAVYGVPPSDKVITNVFNNLRALDGLVLSRLVLTDDILSNAESYFVAECHRRLKKEGFIGVVSFADDISRTTSSGEITHRGHLGTVYCALNAAFLDRGTARTKRLLPDGTVFDDRTREKIRKGDSGWKYGSEILEGFGASVCPEDPDERRVWLKYWTESLTRPLRHPGPLRYAWSFNKKIRLKSLPYPKIRYADIAPQGLLELKP